MKYCCTSLKFKVALNKKPTIKSYIKTKKTAQKSFKEIKP